MKHGFHLLACLLTVVATVCSGAILDVEQCYQEEDQWCWAGCSQSILEYYGTNITQSVIADYGTEGLNEWNWLYGSSTNPTRRGINLILDYFAELETTYGEYVLSQTEVDNIISDLRLLVVRWGWDSGGGHFVVGHGIEGDTMYLMDPWYGSTINDYDWVVSGSSHTWTHSLEVETAVSLDHPNSIIITGFQPISPSAFQISWSSMLYRDYSIWQCTNLAEGDWSPITASPIRAEHTSCSYTVDVSAVKHSFYSIRWEK